MWSVILYLIQPVFLIGLVYAQFNRNKRVHYTREHFRVNFNRKNFELKDYLLKGLLPGIILSLLSLFIGIPLTIEWYLVYQLLTIILLVVAGSRFIHPLFTFPMNIFILYGLNFAGIDLPFSKLNQIFNQQTYLINQTANQLPTLTMNLLVFATLILLVSTFAMNSRDEHKIYPMLKTSKRGKTVAKYQKNSLWALPLMVIVPGEVIEPFADWWPLLNIKGNQYAFLLLPLLVGFHYTVSTQFLEEATTALQTEFRYLAISGVLLSIISYFYPRLSIWSMLLLFLGGLFILVRHRRRENMWSFRYGPADEGLRVIAIRQNSPAERLDLAIGDVILDFNDQELTDMEEYYKTLAHNRSYAKMRIRRKDGEIVIAETPLYDDDYNNLGLLLLDQ